MDRKVLWFLYNILIFKCFILIHLKGNFEHKNEISNSAIEFSKWGTGIVQIPKTLPPVSDLLGSVSGTL